MNSTLKQAVHEQLGGGEDARQYAHEAAEYGADSGFPGFTYTGDTVEFTADNRSAIAELVEEYASELGTTPTDLVAGFSCLRDLGASATDINAALYGTGRGDADVVEMIENALAWFALEEAGRD